MHILYASHRPPYPYFLGGAARCAHRLLLALAQDLGADCAAVGAADYSVARWALPPAADHAALGVRGVRGPAVAGAAPGPATVRELAKRAKAAGAAASGNAGAPTAH